MAGDLNVTWIHGSPGCASTADPAIQVHRYDRDTYLMRQSKCSDPPSSHEAPFFYLLIGRDRAFLLDTGATTNSARVPVAATVDALLAAHAMEIGGTTVPLVIGHTHGHGDHWAGDVQFHDRPHTTIVPVSVAGVRSFYGLPHWPNGTASLDLGNRILDLLPAPGHEAAHIVIHDRATGLLFTGDTLYPGLLVAYDWPAYAATAARVKAFAAARTVSAVLGAHIEMMAIPQKWFGLGVEYQPGEHKLQLEAHHVREWADAVAAIGTHPQTRRYDDFIIFPASDPLPPVP